MRQTPGERERDIERKRETKKKRGRTGSIKGWLTLPRLINEGK